MKKTIILSLMSILVITAAAAAQPMAVPGGQQAYSYSPVAVPLAHVNPSEARPVSVGPAAAGGRLSLRVALNSFTGAVDVYFAIVAPGSNDPHILHPDGSLQSSSAGLIPWQANTTGPIDAALFSDIPTTGFPSGIYRILAAVTPANTTSAYYLWTTYFTVVAGSACSGEIAAEAPAQGDYRAYRFDTGVSVGNVAIANRGWRAVAGGQDYNIYFFNRSQAAPTLVYPTGGQVNAVSISRNGSAFSAGSYDGRIYFFECDQTVPSWIYDTAQDITSGTAQVEGVDISADGRFIAAVSRTHVYLFGREAPMPLLKLDLASGWLSTVAISADGSHLVVGTMPEESGARVFYLNHLGVIWTYSIPDLGWGPNDLSTPVAISADGRVIAAGGRDNRIHLWSAGSPSPLWTYLIAQESPVFSVDLSDDGNRLVATGNFALYFFDSTQSPTPTFTYDGTGGPLISQPVLFPGHDTVPSDSTYSGVGNYLNAVALSADGTYFLAGDYVYNYAFSFYREFSLPFRVHHLADGVDSVGHVDLSPDGSWIMLGSVYNGEILRIEVAPAEIARVDVPLSYNIIDDTLDDIAGMIGGDQFNVDYWIIKPGRAATLRENWSLWAMPAMGAILIPPNDILCVGQMEWSYTQTLADGNVVVTGTRQIDAPQCLESAISSIDLFILDAELRDQPASIELSDDFAILANIQVGSP